MRVIPLSEGSFTIDKTKLFVPFDETQHDLQTRPVGSLLVEVQPFLVVTSEDVLLLDTGLGFPNQENGQLQLITNIKKAGYEPEQVTKILLSHLHKDHVGGITTVDGESASENSGFLFPSATIYVQRRELNYALEKGLPSFVPEELGVFEGLPNVLFLESDDGVIDGGIKYHVTGAHSPFHQVFWIEDEGEIVFFGAHDAPQLQQMKMRYKTKYDHDADKAMNLRREWWEKGNEEGWTFLFYHDIAHAVYKRK